MRIIRKLGFDKDTIEYLRKLYREFGIQNKNASKHLRAMKAWLKGDFQCPDCNRWFKG